MSRLSVLPPMAQARNSVARFSRPTPAMNDSNLSNDNDTNSEFAGTAKKLTKYENTFLLEPTIRVQSSIKSIKDYSETILNQVCNSEYDQNSAKSMAKQATSSIHKHVKGLNLERYRFVVQVYIGEYGNFDIRHSSKFLWNSKFDTFIDAKRVRPEKNLYAIASVFLVYLE